MSQHHAEISLLGTGGWQRCWRRLRVSVLRASECDGSGQEDGAINNSLTERGFCHVAYASQPLYELFYKVQKQIGLPDEKEAD